ncbi:MAG: hypothetical protein CVU18_04585 [Betaproteobacteria bacterium HGW-Betaproteobacteria-12]|nr:MAG: hypothetical protein CVU18_04585 [Betaproteobacteria bacterium HGW-Betaproteobacteria-12]
MMAAVDWMKIYLTLCAMWLIYLPSECAMPSMCLNNGVKPMTLPSLFRQNIFSDGSRRILFPL